MKFNYSSTVSRNSYSTCNDLVECIALEKFLLKCMLVVAVTIDKGSV